MVTKNTGVRNSPNEVTPNMPANTAMPIAWRISLPAPLADHQGNHAHDERKRGHEDGPQTQPARLDRGIDGRQSLLDALAGEFHDQDRVLAGEARPAR